MMQPEHLQPLGGEGEVLTTEEARRVAENIAQLPDLPGAAREE